MGEDSRKRTPVYQAVTRRGRHGGTRSGASGPLVAGGVAQPRKCLFAWYAAFHHGTRSIAPADRQVLKCSCVSSLIQWCSALLAGASRLEARMSSGGLPTRSLRKYLKRFYWGQC